MTIRVPVDEVLERLDHGNRWIQGSWSTSKGECLHNGIRACEIHAGDAYLIEQVAARQGWGTEFNDADGTTFDDVKQKLVEHREILPEELDAVFGPQWQAIVALVRRVATLSDAEIDGLAASEAAADEEALVAARVAAVAAARAAMRAGVAARAAARAAAYQESLAAARAAAEAAARAAADQEAWAAARAAAKAAAKALSVRDLIGSHGFTQTHYNILTGPWATVIGPVHPDDRPSGTGQ